MPIITNITTNEHYFYYVIEIDNSLTYGDSLRYVLDMPPAVGHNFKYNEMCFDVKTSDDYSGNVSFVFSQSFHGIHTDIYDIPVLIYSFQDKSMTSELNEGNNGQTWKMFETSMKTLNITCNQNGAGTGKIFLVVRGSI